MKSYHLVTLLVVLVALIYGNTARAENVIKRGMLRRQQTSNNDDEVESQNNVQNTMMSKNPAALQGMMAMKGTPKQTTTALCE